MGLELTDSAKKWLANKGWDPAMGARPLRRTIQREVEDPLSERILAGELGPGQIVVVDAPTGLAGSTLDFRTVDPHIHSGPATVGA